MLKVADFGMARKVGEHEYYRKSMKVSAVYAAHNAFIVCVLNRDEFQLSGQLLKLLKNTSIPTRVTCKPFKHMT